jgi:hypothetical protein
VYLFKRSRVARGHSGSLARTVNKLRANAVETDRRKPIQQLRHPTPPVHPTRPVTSNAKRTLSLLVHTLGIRRRFMTTHTSSAASAPSSERPSRPVRLLSSCHQRREALSIDCSPSVQPRTIFPPANQHTRVHNRQTSNQEHTPHTPVERDVLHWKPPNSRTSPKALKQPHCQAQTTRTSTTTPNPSTRHHTRTGAEVDFIPPDSRPTRKQAPRKLASHPPPVTLDSRTHCTSTSS